MKKIIVLLFLIGFVFSNVNAQDFDLSSFLAKSELASKQYGELFKNLVADEVKSIKIYKKDGKMDNERQIKSNFIVYQTSDEKTKSEFRTVYEFNGKNVLRSDEDVVKFFSKLSKSDNALEELSKVKKESQRYDGNARVWGATLYQEFFLRSEVRKSFDYKLLEKINIDDSEIYVVEFKQNSYSPYILSNPKKEELIPDINGFSFNTPMSDSLKPTNPRMNGKFWLDAKSGQVWRIDYEVIIQPATISTPLTVTKSSYEYQKSKFGILTPKRLSLSNYQILGKNQKDVQSVLFATTILEYSKFESIASDIKDYKVGESKP